MLPFNAIIMLRIRHQLAAFTTIVCCMASFSSNASESHITVVTENLEPYQFVDSNNLPQGYGIDVLNALFAQAALSSDITFYPWLRAYKKALHTKNTLILSLARTPEREHLFHWIGLIDREQFSFYALKSNTKIKPFESIEDAKQYSITVTKDSVLDNFLTQHQMPFIERSSDNLQTYKMLFRGRADLILKSHTGAKMQTKTFNYDYDDLVDVYEVPEFYSDLYIAINIDSDPQLVKILQDAFMWLDKNNVITDLRVKWDL